MASLNNETSLTLPKTMIGSGMGFMQLVQFFGGSVSVAGCGLLLEYQKNVLPVRAYQNVYGLLFLLCLCSFGVLLWYKLSSSATGSTIRKWNEQ